MSKPGDHDGKQHSASASLEVPSHAEIAARAYELWIEQGRPPGGTQRIWLEAERELKAAAMSHKLIQKVHEGGGSVQR